ncbi:MAG TPA: hypothetical protein VEL77_15150 [Rugosimonospora sp.]|nr:hypothetical protein [Rugosimonospora sp.]
MGVITNLIRTHQESKQRDVMNQSAMYTHLFTAPDEELLSAGQDPSVLKAWALQNYEKLFQKEGPPQMKQHSGKLFGMLGTLAGAGKAMGKGLGQLDPVGKGPAVPPMPAGASLTPEQVRVKRDEIAQQTAQREAQKKSIVQRQADEDLFVAQQMGIETGRDRLDEALRTGQITKDQYDTGIAKLYNVEAKTGSEKEAHFLKPDGTVVILDKLSTDPPDVYRMAGKTFRPPENWTRTDKPAVPSEAKLKDEELHQAYAQKAGLKLPLTPEQGEQARQYYASDQMATITRFRTDAFMAKGMPFAEAYAKARQESITKADRLPASIINLQQTEKDAPSIAQGIKNGLLSPMLTGLGRTGMAGRVTAELAREGYNLAKAQKDWMATTIWIRTLNGPTQVRLRQAVDFTVESLDLIDNSQQPGKDLLGDLRNAVPRTKFPIINKLALNTAKSGIFGQPAAEAARLLDIQITDLQSELATVYQGGNTPTDKSLGQAMKILSGDWDDKTLRAAVNLTRKNLGYRLNSIRNSPAMTEGGVEIGGPAQDTGQGAGPRPGGPTGPSGPSGPTGAPGPPPKTADEYLRLRGIGK